MGIVVDVDPATYNITVSNPTSDKAMMQMQGIMCSNIMASLIGFKEALLPSVGSVVFCAASTPVLCYILCVVPDSDFNQIPLSNRTIIGGGDGNVDPSNVQGYASRFVKQISHNQNRPTDIVAGDYALFNDFGVMLGLFQQFAALKGSELAQIQCFMLDDLVRVVSHNFEQFGAAGEHISAQDGNILYTEGGLTHNLLEALGGGAAIPFKEEGEFSVDDTKDNIANTSDAPDTAAAVPRFKYFVGRLADFLRVCMTIPAPDADNLLDGKAPEIPPLGILDFYVGTDGSFNLRTLASIAIEKTNWVRVPVRLFKADDPRGDDGAAVEIPPKVPFTWDNSREYNSNPFLYFLQLRDYLAYTQEVNNYTNFNALKKDFSVNSDYSKEQQNVEHADELTPVNYRYTLRRGGLYIMDNGGIVLMSSFGSAVVLDGPDVSLQGRDVLVQPLRHLIGKVGQNVSIAAQNDIDMSSTSGGLRVKTETANTIYSKSGGILLHTDALPLPQGFTPADGPVTQVDGIVLKSTNSNIHTSAKNMYDDIIESYVSSAATLVHEAQTDYRLLAHKTAALAAETQMTVYGRSRLSLTSDGSAAFSGAKSTSLGQKEQPLGIRPYPDDAKGPAYQGVQAVNDNVSKQITAYFNDKSNTIESQPDLSKIDFYFLPSSAYNLSAGDCIPQTLAQQNSVILNTPTLKAWKEIEVNGTMPYPGADMFSQFYATCDMQNVTSENGDLVSVVDNPKDSAIIEFEDLNTYKTY